MNLTVATLICGSCSSGADACLRVCLAHSTFLRISPVGFGQSRGLGSSLYVSMQSLGQRYPGGVGGSSGRRSRLGRAGSGRPRPATGGPPACAQAVPVAFRVRPCILCVGVAWKGHPSGRRDAGLEPRKSCPTPRSLNSKRARHFVRHRLVRSLRMPGASDMIELNF